ncbi:MAG: MFS transporter [Acidimicrobiia bacterium]|nr:MFS transporter [Acidimicrobiia bacterium]
MHGATQPADEPANGTAPTNGWRAALRRGAGDTFRSLGVRNYRRYFAGQLVSQAGTWMQTVSVIWVALRLTDSGVALGLVTAAQYLPVLVLGAWGGVVADRVDRQRFMIKTQIGYTIVAIAYCALILTDRLSIGFIYVLSVLFGLLTALDSPTRRTLVVDLVEPELTPNAVALHSAMMTGSRVVGPAVAGALIASAGVEWCFVVNAVSYVAVLAALFSLDRSAIRSSPKVRRAKGQLMEGLRYARGEAELRQSLLLLAVVGTLAFEYQVTLPLLSERTFGAGASGFTLLYSLMSVGSVVGALAMARRSMIDLRFLLVGAWGLVVTTTVLSLAPTLALATVAAVGVGAATILLPAGLSALVQLHSADEFRGRVLSLSTVVFIGSTPIGGPIAGWVSEHYGPRAGLMLGAVSTALMAGWITFTQRRAARATRAVALSLNCGANAPNPAPGATNRQPEGFL